MLCSEALLSFIILLAPWLSVASAQLSFERNSLLQSFGSSQSDGDGVWHSQVSFERTEQQPFWPIRTPEKCLRPSNQHAKIVKAPVDLDKAPPLEIHPLVVSGPSRNRVNLVFFSDGYLAEEKAKFLEDATRLAQDVSGNQTFYTVKPLLNFWAAFTPSKESGIGVGGKPKDTPFGLYRDGTELRGVYYDKPDVAAAACASMGRTCDFPILLANDPFYGGLGGDFTVTTSSVANGALVLRHELGHSIIDVGEEYDGGYAYFGVNAAQDALPPIPWAHWLTKADSVYGTSPRVEKSNMPMQAYPWTMLNVSTPWSVRFRASGLYVRHLVKFSLSGLPEKGDLKVELDGEELGWEPYPDIGIDRWHYDVFRQERGLDNGEHELTFTLRNKEREGTAQLCSAEILEFGDQDEFISTPGHYGLYPTYSLKNETTYRPTNDDCLMRAVTTPNFCKVCLEGLWLSLLRRVDLIDNLTASCGNEYSNRAHHHQQQQQPQRVLQLDLVPLAQFREHSAHLREGGKESYTITWSKDGLVLDTFTNKTSVQVPAREAVGSQFQVDVKFSTDEVRLDQDGVLTASRSLVVTGGCSL